MATTARRPAGRAITDAETESEKERRQRQIEANQETVRLLQSWLDADEEEIQDQKETWEILKKALDEDRWSDRKLFP